jgi:hypothetical protein
MTKIKNVFILHIFLGFGGAGIISYLSILSNLSYFYFEGNKCNSDYNGIKINKNIF